MNKKEKIMVGLLLTFVWGLISAGFYYCGSAAVGSINLGFALMSAGYSIYTYRQYKQVLQYEKRLAHLSWEERSVYLLQDKSAFDLWIDCLSKEELAEILTAYEEKENPDMAKLLIKILKEKFITKTVVL